MRLSVVKPPPFCQRSSELPPERAPPKQGPAEAAPVTTPWCGRTLAPFTLAGP